MEAWVSGTFKLLSRFLASSGSPRKSYPKLIYNGADTNSATTLDLPTWSCKLTDAFLVFLVLFFFLANTRKTSGGWKIGALLIELPMFIIFSLLCFSRARHSAFLLHGYNVAPKETPAQRTLALPPPFPQGWVSFPTQQLPLRDRHSGIHYAALSNRKSHTMALPLTVGTTGIHMLVPWAINWAMTLISAVAAGKVIIVGIAFSNCFLTDRDIYTIYSASWLN